MLCTMPGCVMFKTSKFPRRSRGCFRNCEPRNAASSSCCAWIIVPMAPSKMTILSFRRFFSAAIRVSLRSNVHPPCARWPFNQAAHANASHTLQKSVTNVSLVVYRRELYGLRTFSHPDFLTANRVLPVDLWQAPRVHFEYMRARASFIIGGIALAICLVCPLVDL